MPNTPDRVEHTMASRAPVVPGCFWDLPELHCGPCGRDHQHSPGFAEHLVV